MDFGVFEQGLHCGTGRRIKFTMGKGAQQGLLWERALIGICMGKSANRDLYGKRPKQGFVWEKAQTGICMGKCSNRDLYGKSANRDLYGKMLKQGFVWKFLTLETYGISAEERAAARRRKYGVISKDFR